MAAHLARHGMHPERAAESIRRVSGAADVGNFPNSVTEFLVSEYFTPWDHCHDNGSLSRINPV